MTDRISFPRSWKVKYGFTGASLLSYLVEHERGEEWFPALGADMREELSLHPSSINNARLKLVADHVLEVKQESGRYLYKIDHARLEEIGA